MNAVKYFRNVRRARTLEFLQEVSVGVVLPEEPLELGGDAHARLIEEVLPKMAERSQERGRLTAPLGNVGGWKEK